MAKTHTRYDSFGRGIGPSHKHSQETDIYAPAIFEPTIPASERPQCHWIGAATLTKRVIFQALCFCKYITF